MSRRATDAVTARGLAITILDRVEHAGAFAQPLLERASERLHDARDISHLHALVLGVLRQRRVLDHVIERVASRPLARMDRGLPSPLRVATFEILFLDRVPDFAAVDAAVDAVRAETEGRGTGFANGILRKITRQREALLPEQGASVALRHSYPEWWVRRLLQKREAANVEQLLRIGNEPPPLCLHVNTERMSVADFIAARCNEGVDAVAGEFAEQAVWIQDSPRAVAGPLAAGDCWVQDEGAQLVVPLLQKQGGARVLDLCAAPGGKTMQLSIRFRGADSIVAADRHWKRLRRVIDNLERCGFREPLVVALDGSVETDALRGKFDRILVDAPCSGTGTLRRHPEIRWRLQEADLERFQRRQINLLERACDRLAPDGELVYSVCSIEPEEGHCVIERFLQRRKEFELISVADRLAGRAREFVTDDGCLFTDPAAGLDGFFAAVLHRR